MSERATPIGGPLLTRPMQVLLALAAIGFILLGWRFVSGLGAVTALNDGYPWGLWIAFDVVTGTALACGGYAVAILVYIFNRGRYHPLVRPAILTSALGYTLGGISVVIDLGRFWYTYKVPLAFWRWNFNSILLEVALCIMAYMMVLWIELSPAFLETWKESPRRNLRRFALWVSPRLDRILIWIIALGLLLPTMHQSSLGSLMLLAGHKLHPLWHTPLLPLLFLISCVGMGYAVVVIESCLSARNFGRPFETPMLASLSVVISVALLAFVGLRVGDVALRGRMGLILEMGWHRSLFVLEIVLLLIPALILLKHRKRLHLELLFQSAMLVIAGGALYRFSTYLLAYDPGPTWSYFPAATETLITVGLVSAEIAAYVLIVKRFPILRGVAASGG